MIFRSVGLVDAEALAGLAEVLAAGDGVGDLLDLLDDGPDDPGLFLGKLHPGAPDIACRSGSRAR